MVRFEVNDKAIYRPVSEGFTAPRGAPATASLRPQRHDSPSFYWVNSLQQQPNLAPF